MWVAWASGLPGTWVPGVHANCTHNEVSALQQRSLASNPPYPNSPNLGNRVLDVFSHITRLVRSYDGERWCLRKTAESYGGRLRRRYLEAERSLREDGPLRSSDTLLRAFLKAEKLGSAKDPKPRMIFPRSPRYNLVLASWLKPFEHWLWGYLTARRLFGGSNTRVVGKGLSPRQRANLIVRKFNEFRDCVCFEVDGKAFEAHISSGQISAEHSVYLGAYHNDPELARVLSRQVFRGVTPSGIKFGRPGGRASGDFNTGMGNTLIMLSVVVGVLKSYHCKFDVLVDGDNALVFLECVDHQGVIDKFAADVLEVSGHEMVLERPVRYVEGIRFGRSAPIFLGPSLGWTMVRDPMAVLSGAYASHRYLREPVFGRRWLHGVARCELSLARGIPVLQSAALSVLKQTRSRKRVPVEDLSDYFVVGAYLAEEEDVVEPRVETRVSFHLAFGLSPEDQLAAERHVAGVAVGFPSHVNVMPPRSRWELADPGLYEAWFDAHV